MFSNLNPHLTLKSINNMKYTVDQFLDYVKGWLSTDAVDGNLLDMNAMNACLRNAASCIADPSDGIAAQIEREKLRHYRFEQKHVRTFCSDHDAFEYACGWHDERDASIEKWMHGQWCPAANPIYQPEYFKGKSDGGWICGKKLIPFNS